MFEMRFVTVRKSFSEKPSDMVIETVEVSISEEAGSAHRAVSAVKRPDQPARNHYDEAIDRRNGWGRGRYPIPLLKVYKKL
jgi:hypothetical protein